MSLHLSFPRGGLLCWMYSSLSFFFQAEDGIRDWSVTGVQTCALPIFDAQASTVIIADVKDPKFHVAIFGYDNGAVPDMTADELQQARRYIASGEGTAPVRLPTKPPFPVLIARTDTEGDPSPSPHAA